LRLQPHLLEKLPITDELPDFDVFLVYRSADLMTHACAEFAKEARHQAKANPPWRQPRRKGSAS